MHEADSLSLKDHVILVTGGATGLGLEIAQSIADIGGKVWIASRSEQKLQAAASQISASGGNVNWCVCDVRIKASVDQCVQRIMREEGRIDGLVNSAGIWSEGPVEELQGDFIHTVVETNFLGPILLFRAIVPIMESQEWGQILNVNSTSGLAAAPDWSLYSGTKFALRAFADGERERLAPKGIRVMSVYPGGMDTNFFAAVERKVDRKNLLSPRDVAIAVRFMLTRPKDLTVESLTLTKRRSEPSQ